MFVYAQFELRVVHLDVKVQPVNLNRLMTYLQNENEGRFLREINSIVEEHSDQCQSLFSATDTYNDKGESLLTLAIKKGLPAAVERMIRLGANVNEPLNPVKCACTFGNWRILRLLLESRELDLKKAGPLISIVVRRLDDEKTIKSNYETCFEMLLNHEKIDINQQDEFG